MAGSTWGRLRARLRTEVSGDGGRMRTLQVYGRSGPLDVHLDDAGDRPIQVIKQLREVTGLALGPAKALLDDTPTVVVRGRSRESAEAIAERLTSAGATVHLAERDPAADPPGSHRPPS